MSDLEGIIDIPEDEYHAHPALSSSSAKKLLHPSCPALFRHAQTAGQQHRREFDFGHAAHLVVLGEGPELHVLGADNFKSKATQVERDEAYARGAVPLLPAEFNTVQNMAAALRAHPLAANLFTGGLAEQSLFWVDPETGVDCRARLDYLTHRIVDYKTTTSVELGHISRAVDSFGYYFQAAWYLDGAMHLDLVEQGAEFYFVFQDKNPPHLVTVVELDDTALRIGRERNRFARQIYRDCLESGIWPAYSAGVELISLPAWAVRAHERESW